VLTDGPLPVGESNGTNQDRMTTVQLTGTKQTPGPR